MKMIQQMKVRARYHINIIEENKIHDPFYSMHKSHLTKFNIILLIIKTSNELVIGENYLNIINANMKSPQLASYSVRNN
jgi:hypothetical protein